MRFIDEATIRVIAGHGGPGCVSFRREVFAPRGGPDGGDGGDGGDVIFQASTQLSSLLDLRLRREYQADAGRHGSGANKAGRDGENILIRVPVGTTLSDADTGELLVDLVEEGQTWVACAGGRGGKGNTHFATSTHQAPKFAQPGEEGGSRSLQLKLKLLADAAIVGFPNSGKSTLIARISAARPKIADYAFTTLTPNLGVVTVPGADRSFVVADVPGLIEGAHRGLGLGHRFLKHIERTRCLVHLLDGSRLLDDATRPGGSADARLEEAIGELVRRYEAIRRELGLFDESLLGKPELVVLNKLDLLELDRALVERARAALRAKLGSSDPHMISGVSGAGIPDLLQAIDRVLREQKRAEGSERNETRLPDDPRLRPGGS